MAFRKREESSTLGLSETSSQTICTGNRANARDRLEKPNIKLFKLKKKPKQIVSVSPGGPKDIDEICENIQIFRTHERECAEILAQNDIPENIIRVLKEEHRLHIDDVREIPLQKWGITVMRANMNSDPSAVARLACNYHRRASQMTKVEQPCKNYATMKSEAAAEAPKTSKNGRGCMRELVNHQI